MDRKQAISELSRIIDDIRRPHPVRVAIDGVDASGKTWLARELSRKLRQMQCEVISISIDDFHNPRAIRYAKGRDSAEGFYSDSYDYDAFVQKLLIPLSPYGNLRYSPTHWDLKADSPAGGALKTASPRSILIVDGIFLHRKELRKYWDLSVYVRCSFSLTLQRMLQRNTETTDSPEETIAMFHKRYKPGQEIYIRENEPEKRATIIWDNNDLNHPVMTIAPQ